MVVCDCLVTSHYVYYVKLAASNMQDKTLSRIMPRMLVNIFNFCFVQSVCLAGLSKLGRAKLAYDNLECHEVRGTGVLRRSNSTAVNTGNSGDLGLHC